MSSNQTLRTYTPASLYSGPNRHPFNRSTRPTYLPDRGQAARSPDTWTCPVLQTALPEGIAVRPPWNLRWSRFCCSRSLVGIIQFSVWFWSFQVAEHAAREGARRYAVDPCNPGANNALVRSRVGSAAAGAVAVGGTFSGGNPPAAGDDVTVTVTFRVHQIGGGLVPTPDFITQRATSRVEDVEDC